MIVSELSLYYIVLYFRQSLELSYQILFYNLVGSTQGSVSR